MYIPYRLSSGGTSIAPTNPTLNIPFVYIGRSPSPSLLACTFMSSSLGAFQEVAVTFGKKSSMP